VKTELPSKYDVTAEPFAHDAMTLNGLSVQVCCPNGAPLCAMTVVLDVSRWYQTALILAKTIDCIG
jgi:hypothetical protein